MPSSAQTGTETLFYFIWDLLHKGVRERSKIMWSWPAPPFSALGWIGTFNYRSATHKTVTHPSTNLYLCCLLTSNSLHSTISPLSYWYSSWLDVAWLDLSWFDLSWLDMSQVDLSDLISPDLICLYCPINQTLKVSRKAIWHLLEDLYHTNGKDGKFHQFIF